MTVPMTGAMPAPEPSALQPPALLAEGLTKDFARVRALDGVSFQLRAGEIHALCGENGAGKSTLIKLLAGIHPAGSYGGRLEVHGATARFRGVGDSRAAGIAVIHQELAFVDDMSIAENVFLGREPVRLGLFVDRRLAVTRTAAALADFGVDLDPATPLRRLGIAQKQLVEIVKALAFESRILILDEPTAALSGREVDALLAKLATLRARGIACIYVSHRLEEVFAIADRITVLRDGRSVCTLPASDCDPERLVRHMVGREIGELHARSRATPGALVLAVRDLAVRDPAAIRKDLPRLRGISFELHAGEVLGIGGLMGAGRTELLMHVYGVWGERITGSITLNGAPLPGGPRSVLKAGVALVSEDRRRFGLFGEQSVGFNLSLSALSVLSQRSGIVDGPAETASNRRWFDSLGVKAPGLDARAGRLSGGNQQKVLLGRALMTRPRMVMLDEPTRGIDVAAKADIYRLIDQLTQDGCAVLLVSSELPELLNLSDRILMLRDGSVAGTFDRRTATPEALMGAALGAAPMLESMAPAR
jgi:D-xylose transport system ATP-binding protein